LDPGLPAQAPKQSGLRFAQDDELGIVLGDPEQIQNRFLGLRK
jgi:hypothetical protein